MARHPGGRRLYQFLRRRLFWPKMSVDFYAIAQSYSSCGKNRVTLRRNSKDMQLFPETAPMEFVTIGIFDQLLTTKRGNQFLFAITDWFSKPVKTVSLANISIGAIAIAFVNNWVLEYFPPKWLLFHNGSVYVQVFPTRTPDSWCGRTAHHDVPSTGKWIVGAIK